MNEIQARVVALIEKKQCEYVEYSPARMVGEQLKEIVFAEPASAELLEQDLQKKGMGLADAEKKIRARADEIHKNMKGRGGVAVPPWEAEDILRKFYGLPERTWGPGKEAAAASVAEFKVLFSQSQEILNKYIEAVLELPPDKVQGGVNAIKRMLEATAERLAASRWEATPE